jgi:hypothetical protein
MWAEGVQDQCVTKELNTLLTALYVLIDDHVVTARSGRGRAPLLSDSELITLAVAQMLQGYHSERRWIRHIRSSLWVPNSSSTAVTCASLDGGLGRRPRPAPDARSPNWAPAR